MFISSFDELIIVSRLNVAIWLMSCLLHHGIGWYSSTSMGIHTDDQDMEQNNRNKLYKQVKLEERALMVPNDPISYHKFHLETNSQILKGSVIELFTIIRGQLMINKSQLINELFFLIVALFLGVSLFYNLQKFVSSLEMSKHNKPEAISHNPEGHFDL